VPECSEKKCRFSHFSSQQPEQKVPQRNFSWYKERGYAVIGSKERDSGSPWQMAFYVKSLTRYTKPADYPGNKQTRAA
jgi:hypothetical protein